MAAIPHFLDAQRIPQSTVSVPTPDIAAAMRRVSYDSERPEHGTHVVLGLSLAPLPGTLTIADLDVSGDEGLRRVRRDVFARGHRLRLRPTSASASMLTDELGSHPIPVSKQPCGGACISVSVRVSSRVTNARCGAPSPHPAHRPERGCAGGNTSALFLSAEAPR